VSGAVWLFGLSALVMLAGGGLYLVSAALIVRGNRRLVRYTGRDAHRNMLRGFAFLIYGLSALLRMAVPEAYGDAYSWGFVAAMGIIVVLLVAAARGDRPA
jgi:hypothetical protein